jgi:hypothetical protein
VGWWAFNGVVRDPLAAREEEDEAHDQAQQAVEASKHQREPAHELPSTQNIYGNSNVYNEQGGLESYQQEPSKELQQHEMYIHIFIHICIYTYIQ